MAAEITQIDAQSFISQTYEGNEISLISFSEIDTTLTTGSYIELFIYDNNQNILFEDYNFTQYTVLNNGQSSGTNNSVSQIEIDPEKVLVGNGFDEGEYITYFNFFNKQIGSELQQLYISEISSDRTELRLDSTFLTDLDLTEQTNNFVQQRENSPYFVDFYLNFGENQLIIANNVRLDNLDPANVSILIKLYEPLPEEFNLNSQTWVVTSLDDSLAYKVTFEDFPFVITDTIPLKGPNFNLDLKDRINNSTVSLDYATLTSTTLTSSFNQLSSLLEEKEIDINIDYTNFNDFIHFSSAQTRLENFYYKVSLLEQYSASIAILNNTISNNPNASIAIYETYINDIITNFDGYEYYLYYSSGSWAWPKSTSQPPYQLYSTGSTQVLNWFGSVDETSPLYGGILLSASIYDDLNKDYLYYVIPEYLRDDPANNQYKLFIDMVGQFYDNIWIYYKDVTEKYNADNRLEYGISKDIVADAIREFGIKLYQNNFSIQDLYTAFIGLTPEGGLFPFPNITGSLPTPSGFEYVNTLISASNDYMPLDDVNKSLYKRIYHNLPYLLKSKGTLPGLRTLITSYGIPDTVLRINEYGGKDKVNANDWDFWQDTFNYAFYTTGSNSITSKWSLNPNWNSPDNVPATLAFRFKTEGLPTSSISYSQSLWYNDVFSSVVLQYTGSGYASGSYSGSIIDPYYQYANLVFYPDPTNHPASSASIYLPFFDGGWWSVMVTRNGNDFNLYSGNKIYEGGDNGTLLGFYSSSFINEDSTSWTLSTMSIFAAPNTVVPGGPYDAFSGSLQEIRYYNSVIKESVFKDYIMNPYSIEGNLLNSSPNELAFRAPLGGELYTGSVSIHPKITGSWIPTSSFVLDSDFYFTFIPTFNPNTEYFFIDQPVVGIKNAISDKIRIENDSLPSGDTLSAFRPLSQNVEISQSYTANTNLLEVAFSPQDEINDDIMGQIGYFNIGEYIGDPRFRSSSALSYPELDTLRNAYFEKYTKNYDLNDFIRLIKFFDNSLFKMIKDFVPARTSLASGIVIKQSILERNRYPEPQVDNYSTIAYTTSGSANNVPFTFQNIIVTGTLAPSWNDYQPGTVENFSGGTGGVFDPYNSVLTSPYGANGIGPNNIYFLTQSWVENTVTPLGLVPISQSTQDEFYNGEFSGSNLIVTTQSLAQPYPLQNVSLPYQQVLYFPTLSGSVFPLNEIDEAIFFNNFINPITSPQNGEMMIFIDYETYTSPFPGSEYAATYFKIAKIDSLGNDNSIVLGQLDKILIFKSSTSQYVEYNLGIPNEYPNYYLYQVISPLYGNFPFVTADNKILNYPVSASGANVGIIVTGATIKPYSSVSGNSLGYFNSTTGIHTLGNTPNTPLSITGSISVGGLGGVGTFFLSLLRQGNTTTLSSVSVASGNSYSISSSYYGLQGDQIFTQISRNSGILTAFSGSLLITQSRTPNSPSSVSNIVEPYIAEPNYYYSNFNPVMNNVDEARLNSLYQDIDYSSNILTPVNFSLLISGSALKATVQDSNYSSKRVINPRYNGVKSTSQQLNTWTPGDTGTYGKTPTVSSLKNMVAYCDSISGWPAERMNASAIHILYLIKSDGTVVIPNTSENSLYDNKGTFESGEKLIIKPKTTNAGNSQQYRNIIRGGTRIEPILYSQSGSTPNAQWNTSMSFEDIVLTSNGAVGNYTALYNKLTFQNVSANSAFATLTFPNTVYGIPVVSNGYKIPLNAISDGVDIILTATIKIEIYQQSYSPALGVPPPNPGSSLQTYLRFAKNGTGISNTTQTFTTPIQLIAQTSQFLNLSDTYYGTSTATISYLIPNANLNSNDTYTVEIGRNNLVIAAANYKILPTTTKFQITQQPIPTLPITSSGVNSLWGWPNKTTYPNVITSSNSTLSNFFGDPNVKMKDITGSGFNPVTLPWSIKYADEFRFEGREDYVYQVGKIFGPSDSGSGRITQTGSIEVHFNYDLPVSASSSVFNLDHFLIRRYIDDASLVLMEGFKPINSSGPFIVRPEYVVPELDKSVDEFILDLTQKGLIT